MNSLQSTVACEAPQNARLGRGSKAMDGVQPNVAAERLDSRRHGGKTGVLGAVPQPSGGQLQKIAISNTLAQCVSGDPAPSLDGGFSPWLGRSRDWLPCDSRGMRWLTISGL